MEGLKMKVEIKGNENNYTTAIVRAFVYKLNGEFQNAPVVITEKNFSNQFSIYELISMISLEVGMDKDIFFFEDEKPDIRMIEINFVNEWE